MPDPDAMNVSIGLYGKLPAKRDFVVISMPDALLRRWEPWMQQAVADSHATLGDEWRDMLLTAPVWRFWLGRAVCDLPVVGAFVPSVDAVGRLYPLTIFATAGAADAFPSPHQDMQSTWFTAVETLLSEIKDTHTPYDRVVAALDALPRPAVGSAPSDDPDIVDVSAASLFFLAPEDQPYDVFSRLLDRRNSRLLDEASFFWTAGGDDYPPSVSFCDGLPASDVVTAFWSGHFPPAPEME